MMSDILFIQSYAFIRPDDLYSVIFNFRCRNIHIRGRSVTRNDLKAGEDNIMVGLDQWIVILTYYLRERLGQRWSRV